MRAIYASSCLCTFLTEAGMLFKSPCDWREGLVTQQHPEVWASPLQNIAFTQSNKNKRVHTQKRTQSPCPYTISSWSFLPASTRKMDVVSLRTAPGHSAPAGQTGKYHQTSTHHISSELSHIISPSCIFTLFLLLALRLPQQIKLLKYWCTRVIH